MKNNLYYFNNLRTFLVVLVVIAHVLIFYQRDWYMEGVLRQHIPGMGSFFLILRSFIMSLFFFVSGYFIPNSLEKHGPDQFLKNKFIRLGIPVLLFVPLGFKHLWYLENLLFLCVICWFISKYLNNFFIIKERPIINLKHLIFFAICTGFFCCITRYVFHHSISSRVFLYFTFDPSHSPQFILLFWLGIIANKSNWIEKISDTNAKISFVISITLMIGAAYINGLSPNDTITRWWYGIYESFICVFFDYGVIWFFRKYCNKTNLFLNECSKLSYGVHIVHYILIEIILYVISFAKFNVALEIIIICILAVCISFMLSWLLKRIDIVNKVI